MAWIETEGRLVRTFKTPNFLTAYHLVSAVVGPALVRYREGATIHDADVPAGEVWRFRFPPGVAHAFWTAALAAW